MPWGSKMTNPSNISCFSSGTLSWNCYIKNVVLFEENSILPFPERLESSGRQFLRVDVSQESPKHRGGGTASRETLGRIPEGPGGSPRDTPPSLSAKKVL